MKDQPETPKVLISPPGYFTCWKCHGGFKNPPHRTVPHEHGDPTVERWCGDCWMRHCEDERAYDKARQASVGQFQCWKCDLSFSNPPHREFPHANGNPKGEKWCKSCWDAWVKINEAPTRVTSLPTRMQWLLQRRLDVLEEIARVAPKAGIGDGSKRIGNLACEVLWLEHLIEQVQVIEATEKGTK